MLKLTSPTRRFLRHYVEMVAVMFAGMVVLGVPAEIALRAAGSGSGELMTDAPALLLLGMAATMTVPMVAWMRRMGHGWRPCNEMAASMVVPTLAAIALMAAGRADAGDAMTLEHVLMLPAMLLAMLARREEYSCGHVHAPAAIAA